MQPNQDQDNNTDIKQHRTGRITDAPSQPHVTGPTEGFISSLEGNETDINEKKASYSRSDLQASGMQPSEEFLKEQQANQQDISKELDQVAKKKPRLMMTLIVVGAILIAIGGIVLAFSLIS